MAVVTLLSENLKLPKQNHTLWSHIQELMPQGESTLHKIHLPEWPPELALVTNEFTLSKIFLNVKFHKWFISNYESIQRKKLYSFHVNSYIEKEKKTMVKYSLLQSNFFPSHKYHRERRLTSPMIVPLK